MNEGQKLTRVTINNPMCGVHFDFECTKSDFMDRFENQLAGVGYFIDKTIEGKTLVINPSNCSFIEIDEVYINPRLTE